jgi:hypothetical protein
MLLTGISGTAPGKSSFIQAPQLFALMPLAVKENEGRSAA